MATARIKLEKAFGPLSARTIGSEKNQSLNKNIVGSPTEKPSNYTDAHTFAEVPAAAI
jgi:hypothetical protein